MTEFEDFLTENSLRKYPFKEDSALPFSDDVILDVRGFHKEKADIQPRLAAIVGESAEANTTYPAEAGYWALYFEMGRDGSPLRFKLLIPNDEIYPKSYRSSVADSIYVSSLLGSIVVTVGEGLGKLDKNSRIILESALIEPCLVACLYRNQIDSVRIEHKNGESEYIGGDLMIRGGYNLSVTGSDSINLNAAPGSGELGFFTGTISGESVCSNKLVSISGITADSKQDFEIHGGKGVFIKNLADQHKIQIVINRPSMSNTSCL